MLNWYHLAKLLRSGAFPSLAPNRHNNIMYGRRFCDAATATICNNQPLKLRCTNSLHVSLYPRDNLINYPFY